MITLLEKLKRHIPAGLFICSITSCWQSFSLLENLQIIPTKPQEDITEPVVNNKEDNKSEKTTIIKADSIESQPDLPNYAYLGNFLKPWEHIKGDRLIEINFENAQLINLIKYFEKEYDLKFILDNVIDPLPEGGRSPIGIKFSFKTEKPLNKRQAWDVFIVFLDMAGLMVIPGPAERVYQITNNQTNSRLGTNKEPLPTFIGVDTSLLPTSDIKIRYVYFIQNTSIDAVRAVVERLRSPISSPPIIVQELNALILTDKASNVRTIVTILKELDKAILPETLSVMKLKKTDASKVKELYDSLVAEERTLLQRIAPGGRKQSTPFTENVRVVADKRTNSLIILGPRQNVKKIEEFIQKEIDKEVDLPYSPLHVYPLKFIDAETTAQIITDLKNSFQPESSAAQVGGVIGGVKFLRPTVTITAEKSTNSLIINADYDDYLQIYELLEKIDTEQPQVAIRALVLDVNLQQDKDLGIQLRNRKPTLDGVLSNNVNFQTSGLPQSLVLPGGPIVQNFRNRSTGATRLLGDLINLASGNVAGSTVLTLGSDAFGIWGIFKVLQQNLNTSVIAKPFIITTHKYNAQLTITDIRRVVTSNIMGVTQQTTTGDLDAGLKLNITPQISPDGLVTLAVSVENSIFSNDQGSSSGTINPTDNSISNGNRNVKQINTSVILADDQVLALGGLVIDRDIEAETKVPILGDIPLLGWFFKNRFQTKTKTSLLILISAHIVQPKKKAIDDFTISRINAADDLLTTMRCDEQEKDPINRWFFQDNQEPMYCKTQEFIKPALEQEGLLKKPSRGSRRAQRLANQKLEAQQMEKRREANLSVVAEVRPPEASPLSHDTIQPTSPQTREVPKSEPAAIRPLVRRGLHEFAKPAADQGVPA